MWGEADYIAERAVGDGYLSVFSVVVDFDKPSAGYLFGVGFAVILFDDIHPLFIHSDLLA